MLLHQYGTLDSFRYKIQGTKWDISKTFIYAKNLRGANCYHEPTRKKMLGILKNEAMRGVYNKQFFDHIHKSFQKTILDIKKFAFNDFSKGDLETLPDYYLRYYKIYQLTFLPMMVSIYSSDLQEFFENELKKVLNPNEKGQEKIIEIISFLLAPSQLTEVQKEEQLLILVQNKFIESLGRKNLSKVYFKKFCQKPKINRLLNELETKHGWFHQEYVGKAKNKKDYTRDIWETIYTNQHRLEAFEKQQLPSLKLNKSKEKQKKFFRKHKKAVLLKRIISAMQEFALLLDYSKADLIYGIYLARPLIAEIRNRLRLETWIDVHNLTPDEVVAALKRGKLTSKDKTNIAARRKEFAMLYDNGKISIYHGKKAREMKEKLLRQEKTAGIREFSGLTAMTGRVRGIAKTVISSGDVRKLARGDVMITNEVTTELTAALKKAAAIVADGGGIISHTAIVAREFKIPCIVGTKIATKVLKSGDKIEVDASGSTGIVKIIKEK